MMHRPLGRASRTLALVGLLALAATPARAAFLTGAVVYSTDASGAPSSGEYWNTAGGDNRYNLYIAIGPNDPILNPGDSTSTSLNLALPVGTYTYDLYGENAVAFDHYALALFFNENNGTPGIVASAATIAPASSPTTPIPLSTASVGLDTSPATSPGAMSFTDATTTVSLVSFAWNPPTSGGLDRVSGYGSTPSGAPDFVGSITINVTPVPEPGSIALLGLGALGAGGLAWRRRQMPPVTT
jgi:hypothetical protein